METPLSPADIAPRILFLRGQKVMLDLDLAAIYQRLGLQDQFLALTRSLLENKEMPPQVYVGLAQLFAQSRNVDLMATALEQYVAHVPADPQGWVDLAAVQLVQHKHTDAMRSLQQAIKAGGDAIRATLQGDPRFDPVRGTKAYRAIVGGP